MNPIIKLQYITPDIIKSNQIVGIYKNKLSYVISNHNQYSNYYLKIKMYFCSRICILYWNYIVYLYYKKYVYIKIAFKTLC